VKLKLKLKFKLALLLFHSLVHSKQQNLLLVSE
jgi:hypothetical protein